MSMTLPVGLLLLAVSLVTLPAADPQGPTPYPDQKNDAAWPGTGPIRCFDWMVHNRKSFWDRRAKDRGAAVVLVGDSLTGGWDNKVLAATFPGMAIANRGIGGDVTRGLLFRFSEDVLDLEPKAMVLCIGSNDLSCHASTAGIASNIATLIDQARARFPTLPIILCTVPPRDNPKAPTKPGAHADLNQRIAALATAKNVTLLDLFPLLSDADGKPLPDCFAADRIHLISPGYQRWADALKPLLAP